MEPYEKVLSDVHLDCNNGSTEMFDERRNNVKIVRSRFLYKENICDGILPNKIKRSLVDEDGDLDPIRKEEVNYGTILIDHCLATTFEDVGLQIWSSCLLLCDFILDRPQVFKEKCVLELGAGVGLASLICSRFTGCILCTDSSAESLKLCQRNYQINEHWLGSHHNIKFACLDWSEESPSIGWLGEDQKLLRSVDVIIASDVIFSNELTDALISSIVRIINDCSKEQIDVYIALEKRLNFTLEEKAIACPAYSHFMLSMRELCSSSVVPHLKFEISQIVDCNRHFIYERSKYLELWHLKAIKSQSKNEQYKIE